MINPSGHVPAAKRTSGVARERDGNLSKNSTHDDMLATLPAGRYLLYANYFPNTIIPNSSGCSALYCATAAHAASSVGWYPRDFRWGEGPLFLGFRRDRLFMSLHRWQVLQSPFGPPSEVFLGVGLLACGVT